MKRFCLASALLFAAALLAQPASAADYYAPRQYGPRHHAHPHHAYPQYGHHLRTWSCNEYGNCQPNWGWGKDVATGPVAAVIVARGPVPIIETLDRFQSCQAPRRAWTGWRWVKIWDENCQGE